MNWEIVKVNDNEYFIWTGDDLTGIGLDREEIISLIKDTYGSECLGKVLNQLTVLDNNPKEAQERLRSIMHLYETHGKDLRKAQWLRSVVTEPKDDVCELLRYYNRLSSEDRILLIKVARSMIKQ